MSVYAKLEWYDRGAVYKLLSEESSSFTGNEVTGSYLTSKYQINLATQKFMYKIPVKDNISAEYRTEYKSLSDRAGGIVGSGIELFTGAASASGNLTGLASYFDLQTWSKTEPMQFQLEALFFTESNSLLDVIVPMKSLESLTVLSKNDDGTYRTPGVNMSNFGAIQKANQNTQLNQEDFFTQLKDVGKFIKVDIPGRIKLDICLLESATPEYSSETTSDGSPLWGKLDLRLISLFPANDQMLVDPLRDVLDRRTTNLAKTAGDNFVESQIRRSPLGDIFTTF